MVQLIENVISAACGLVCEDISVRIDDGKIVAVEGACPQCASRLVGRTASEGEGTDRQPAIEQAAEILTQASAPLIHGLAGATVETQRAAIALADQLGGTLDPAMPAWQRAAIAAMQSVGVSTCTLGEVRQRADVVVLWGADPAATHPRLYERIIDPVGKFVPGGRYIVGVGYSAPQIRVDDFLQIDSGDTLSVLTALRASIAHVARNTHHASNPLDRLAERLQQADYSVFLHGPGIGGVAEFESLFLLVRQLNLQSRSAALGLGGLNCENVLTWQTGYPCGVNFALGYPRYDPFAYSANTLLERGEVDAVLLVGSAGLDELSTTAKQKLAALPTVLIEHAGTQYSLDAAVRMTTAMPGVHCGGMLFRMDGVPLPLRPIFDSPLPTSADILRAIQQRVPAQCD